VKLGVLLLPCLEPEPFTGNGTEPPLHYYRHPASVWGGPVSTSITARSGRVAAAVQRQQATLATLGRVLGHWEDSANGGQLHESGRPSVTATGGADYTQKPPPA